MRFQELFKKFLLGDSSYTGPVSIAIFYGEESSTAEFVDSIPATKDALTRLSHELQKAIEYRKTEYEGFLKAFPQFSRKMAACNKLLPNLHESFKQLSQRYPEEYCAATAPEFIVLGAPAEYILQALRHLRSELSMPSLGSPVKNLVYNLEA
jgi:hypothetical protein